MATGVISIARHLPTMPAIAHALVGVNWVAYTALWALTLLRVWRFPSNVAADLSSHQRAPGFFTIVAGTCVLGMQNAVVADAQGIASALWFHGGHDPRAQAPLASGINGAWLIAAVATQSIVVLEGTLGAASVPSPKIQFLCLAMFMIGCMFYLAIIPLIFYRLTFVRLSAHDFSPPYWINMGTVAITTLAGSILLFRTNGASCEFLCEGLCVVHIHLRPGFQLTKVVHLDAGALDRNGAIALELLQGALHHFPDRADHGGDLLMRDVRAGFVGMLHDVFMAVDAAEQKPGHPRSDVPQRQIFDDPPEGSLARGQELERGPRHAIPAAERAIETGDLPQVKGLILEEIDHALAERLAHVREAGKASKEPKSPDQVQAARDRVSAELAFVGFVETQCQAAHGGGHNE